MVSDEIEIELVDDLGATASQTDDFGALEGANNPDKNQITVTYDLEVSGDLSSIYDGTDSSITNTARATFANIDDGQEFPEIEDDAAVEVRQPTATKEICYFFWGFDYWTKRHDWRSCTLPSDRRDAWRGEYKRNFTRQTTRGTKIS